MIDENKVILESKNIWEELTDDILEQGKQWYYDKHDFCKKVAFDSNTPLIKTCAVYAALSPLKPVSENDRLCKQFVQGVHKGHTEKQVSKCQIILEHNVENITFYDQLLNGEKTVSFFRNLYQPDDPNYVTVDRHILNLCSKNEKLLITPNRYRIISEGIKKFAKKVKLKPNQTQAVLWILSKNKYGKNYL
jgi:hypothetical protein